MPTKQEMLDKIYEVIADKTESFWCLARICDMYSLSWWVETISMSKPMPISHINRKFLTKTEWLIGKDKITVMDWEDGYRYYNNIAWNWIYTVIWHPVMIWDVLDYMEKWPNFFDEIIPVVDLWIHLRKPIDEQPMKIIEYVYNLCK